ncbi:MAG: hypothetical protein WC638_03700 [Candidatus Paceibacterota bacterium]|jgi:hypothetical protein
MSNLKNKESMRAKERQMLPFAVEFVKFFIAFVVIIATALFTLRFAAAAL